jgi:hypothetical protein
MPYGINNVLVEGAKAAGFVEGCVVQQTAGHRLFGLELV